MKKVWLHSKLRYVNSLKTCFVVLNKSNWVFASNSDFPIPISLQPKVVDLRYFKPWTIFDQIIWFWNYQTFTPSGCKDKDEIIWVCWKKTQFLLVTSDGPWPVNLPWSATKLNCQSSKCKQTFQTSYI